VRARARVCVCRKSDNRNTSCG